MIAYLKYHGAPTVVASLWKVDDAATMLLMARFYENLLGQFTESRGRFSPGETMSKAGALREAKQWLRGLTAKQVRRQLNVEDKKKWTDFLRDRGIDTAHPVEVGESDAEMRPFAHPFYWGAFILIGDPG